MAATLQLYLLGAFELKYGGEVVTAVDSARVQSLLAYLVLHRSAPQLRQHIAFLFWPDTSEAQARTNLRKVLMLLRRALPDADNYLVMTAKSVQWRAQAPLELDVERFEQGYAHADSSARWQEAIELYRGDLMPSCYDEWIPPVRERLHQAFVDLCERLIQSLELSHDYRRALHYAQRLLRHDPVRESSYRQLMQLYARLGEYSSGLRVYHDCSTVLRREMDVEPNAETQALYQQLLNPTTSRPASLAQSAAFLATEISAEISAETDPISGPISGPIFGPISGPIFGRQIEWRALQSLWEKLPPSQPHFVLIAGEAGIGKSRLAEEFLYWVNQRGATVARTRSWSGEGRIAYAPVTTLLRSDALRPHLGRLNDIWLHQIARLLPEVREERHELPYPDPLHEEWQRQHFYDALARAVTIDNKPLLLLFDDLQWCDQQTLEWLRFLLRSGYERQLLVIGTARLEEIADNDSLLAMLRNLRQADQITELELSVLNQEDVARLASHMTHRPVENEVAAHLYRKTEGNPLFVIETLRAGLKAETSRPAGVAQWTEPMESVPSKIQAVIQARLAQLSPTAQEVAAMAATIGRSFTVAVIAEVWQQDENALTWGLDELWRRRIVREQGVDAYDFSHDRMREVVYDQLSPTQRRLYHRRVAQAIERLSSADLDSPKIDEVSGELGMHFERAGENEKARIYWQRAGNYALESHALRDAIANFERALRLAEKPDWQADAYIGLGRAYFALDEADSVLANVEKAQHLLPALGPHTAKLFHLQAEVFFSRYEIEQAEEAALAMQQAAEATDDAEALCQSLSLLGQLCSTRGELDQEVTLITRALSIARQSQNRWREGRTLADLGWIQAQRGEFAQAILAAEQARAILETSADRAGVAFVWNVLGRAYGGAGSYRSAFAAFRQSQDLAATIDHKFLLAQAPNMLGWLHEQLCDYAGALRLDQEGLAVAEQWQKRPAAISARINIATDLRNLGQPQQALTQLQEVQQQIERETFGFHSWRWRLRLLHGEGHCYLALAQPTKAYLLAREGLTLAQSTTSRKYLALNLALLGMAQAQIGLVGKTTHDAAKLHEAMAALASAVDLADEISYQPLRWEGRRHLATVAAALGHHERALVLLRSADQIISSIADGLDSVPLRSLFLTSAPVQAIFQALQSVDG